MSNGTCRTGVPLTRVGRVGLLALSVLLLAGFVLARWLEPDPRGFGTHEQLGLPECAFQLLWERPCPGCGMTTCFAHWVRGEWRAAWRAHPAGVLLAVQLSLALPWMWGSAWRGELIGVSEPLPTFLTLLLIQVTITAGIWVWRMWS